MRGAPERPLAGARTFLVMSQHNNNGLQSTVDKSVELRWVVCGVAEPHLRMYIKNMLK
jgi:hypothetical protein